MDAIIILKTQEKLDYPKLCDFLGKKNKTYSFNIIEDNYLTVYYKENYLFCDIIKDNLLKDEVLNSVRKMKVLIDLNQSLSVLAIEYKNFSFFKFFISSFEEEEIIILNDDSLIYSKREVLNMRTDNDFYMYLDD